MQIVAPKFELYKVTKRREFRRNGAGKMVVHELEVPELSEIRKDRWQESDEARIVEVDLHHTMVH